MANRTIFDSAPDPVALLEEYFRATDRDFKGLPLGQVGAHARARWAVSYAVLHLVRLLDGLGRIGAGATFRCGGAEMQDKSAFGDTEAAHALPGHITVRGPAGTLVPLYDLLRNPFNRTWVQRNLFGLTHRVHWLVNQADSNSENGPIGMKWVLARACERVAQPGGSPDLAFEQVLVPGYLRAAQSALTNSEGKVTATQRAAASGPNLVNQFGSPLTPRPPDTALRGVGAAEAGANRATLAQVLNDYCDRRYIDRELMAAFAGKIAALRHNEQGF